MQHKPMKRWARRAWITALESGKYKETKNQMRVQLDIGIAHDPLGVLCEAMRNIGPCVFQPARDKTEEDRYFCKNKHGVDAQPVIGSYVPDTLAEALGLTAQAQYDIANMADAGANHKEVARWIAQNL